VLLHLVAQDALADPQGAGRPRLDPAAFFPGGDEHLAFHEAVAAAFDTLAALEPNRFSVIDASLPLDTVVSHTVQALRIGR